MRPTRSYSGQHFVQRVVHLGSLFRVERVHGAHQNFERIARKRFLTFARQSQTDFPETRGAAMRKTPLAWTVILHDLLLFSCLAAFVTGIVIAAASLLS
jgi:hypothetical protein